MQSNPYLTKPRNPNYLRRAKHHDYTRPGKYMLTLSKAPTTVKVHHSLPKDSTTGLHTPKSSGCAK